jgi:glycosyltransferase
VIHLPQTTISPYHHTTTSPPHHITTSPYHHITISPHHHITTSPHHHLTPNPQKTMKISIITATYNSEKTIEACINSLQAQDYENIEHIIIDGNSSDQTCQIISNQTKNNPRVIFKSEPDNGIYDALNKGIKQSTGDIIGFLHSDDEFYDQRTLSNIAAAFKSNNSDGVYGDLQYVSAHKPSRVIRHWKSKIFQDKHLSQGWMPPHPTLFLKKEVYQKHGLFDVSFKIAADYDYILRIFKDATLTFHYLPETISIMRLGGASNSLNNIRHKIKEDLYALRKNRIPHPYAVILKKNLSKIPQLFRKQSGLS